MDGIHDLGGMQGFGRVEVESDEPVFHARWEGRVFALAGLAGAGLGANIDRFRHAIERLDPLYYLAAGYYGRWLQAAVDLLEEEGVLEAGELERRAGAIAAGETPPPAASAPAAPAPPAGRRTVRRDVEGEPRFAAGDRVRARDLHRRGHTRLPRYARGRRGVIATVYPAYVFPDTHAHGRGECPQHLYSVRFEGAELWGEDAEPGTAIFLDLFESYLEPHGE